MVFSVPAAVAGTFRFGGRRGVRQEQRAEESGGGEAQLAEAGDAGGVGWGTLGEEVLEGGERLPLGEQEILVEERDGLGGEHDRER